MKTIKPTALFLTLLCLLAPQAWSADGDLDLSFGSNGRVFSTAINNGMAVIQQQDGKLVVAGASGTGLALVRYNPNGSVDTTFGSGGTASTSVAAKAYSVIQQADGKLVAAGYGGSGTSAVVRFNPNGTLDTSFGTAGVVSGGALPTYIQSVIQQMDGKLVVTGRLLVVARLNSNGTFDTGFDGDGVVAQPFASAGAAFSLIQQTDGRLVVAGYVSDSSFYSTALVRYNTNGTLDTSFGSGGTLKYDFYAGYYDNAFSMIQQPDGKLVIAGYGFTTASQIFLARFLANGTLDTSFGLNGRSDIGGLNITSSCSCDQLTLIQQQDGKLVISDARYGNSHFLVIRTSKDGALDNTFNDDGILIQPLGAQTFDDGYGVVQQSDGKLVIAGQTGSPIGMGMIRIMSQNVFDADNDTITDASDNCPLISNATQTNTDNTADGGDVCDADDDNDGALDVNDAFPLDASETLDTDGDGTGNNADTDDDGDSYADTEDAYPLNPYKWKFPSCDFDGDSDSDILVRDLVTGLWKIFNVQAAVVTSNVTIGIPDDVYTQHMAVLDSDGDGDKDILTRNSSTGLWTLYEVDAGNTVAAHPLALYANASWHIVATGDFNGDAVEDVLLRDSAGGSYRSFLLGNHAVVQVKYFNGWLSSQSVDQGVGDFDGDGTDDLLVRRSSDNLYFIYRVQDGNVASISCLCNLWKNPDWTFQFASDMNADGSSDIVIRGTGPSADGKWWRFQINNKVATNTAYFNLYYNKDKVKLGAVGDYNGDGTNDVILRVDDATTYVAPVANGLVSGHSRIGNFGAGEAIEQ